MEQPEVICSETRIESVRAEVDREIAHAKDVYASHWVVKESSGRWLCKGADGSNNYWFEVIVLAGNRLFIHGDFDPILFAQYYPFKEQSEEENKLSCLEWMATQPRPDYGYFINKAVLGSGEAAVWKSDDDVLRAQIEEMIEAEKNPEDDDVSSEVRSARIEKFESALRMVDGVHSHDEVKGVLYEALDYDSEMIPDGKRISLGMVFAHAALQKLWSIVKQRRDQ